jgi:hypothetical protein
MKVSRADIKKNLPQKGFKKKKFGHHIYFHHSMRKQLRLDSMKETVALIKCPMDKKEYEKILIDREVFYPDPSSKKHRR